MKYFFDNSISFRIANALRALKVNAVALREELSENSTDTRVFDHLHGLELAFIATDFHQLTRIAEARKLKSAGITALYLGPFFSKMEFWPQATWFVRQWPSIDKFACASSLGTVGEIKQNGRVTFLQL